jgi:hypothetical protein
VAEVYTPYPSYLSFFPFLLLSFFLFRSFFLPFSSSPSLPPLSFLRYKAGGSPFAKKRDSKRAVSKKNPLKNTRQAAIGGAAARVLGSGAARVVGGGSSRRSPTTAASASSAKKKVGGKVSVYIIYTIKSCGSRFNVLFVSLY